MQPPTNSQPTSPGAPPAGSPPPFPGQTPTPYPGQMPTPYPGQPSNLPAPMYAPMPVMYMAPMMPFQARPEPPVNQLPLIALITGVVAWPFLFTAPSTSDFPFLALIMSLLPITLGHIALVRTPPEGMSRGNGMAIAGLILGYFLLSIALVWAILRFFPPQG